MLFSNACEYGIRAVLFLAVHPAKEYMSVGEMSKNLNISFHFLTKTLQKLTKEKILKSYRGPQGGIGFDRSPEDITISEIIIAIDGENIFKDCIIGLPNCDDTAPCPLHGEWKKQRENLIETFSRTTVSELAEQIKSEDFRLSEKTNFDLNT